MKNEDDVLIIGAGAAGLAAAAVEQDFQDLDRI
jgi:thioredoxin reductase